MLAMLAAEIRRAWRGRTLRTRIHVLLLPLLTLAVVGHHAVLFDWYIEDAAIDFAYAKHVVAGEGLVPFPGGERVEGYSNPLWLAVLVAFQALGHDLFVATQWIQLALGVATVPVVYALAREASGPDSDVPIVATAFLAASSQFAVWGASGLENALLSLLMALGLWRTLVEVRRGGWPCSALVWLGVALTRPEGIGYAAIAGATAAAFHLHAGRRAPILAWLAAFFVPWTAYQAWHLYYFAWPLPNTFYAKIDEGSVTAWSSWSWTRSFFLEMGQGFFLPVWLFGLGGDARPGAARWRVPALLGAFVLVGLAFQLPDPQRFLVHLLVPALLGAFWLGLRAVDDRPPPALAGVGLLVAGGLVGLSELLRAYGTPPNRVPVPDGIVDVAPWALGALALTLPGLAMGTSGWRARALCWWSCCAAVFFAVYADGDWMKGYRWFAVAVVPGAVLFGFGVEAFAAIVPAGAWRAAFGVFLVLAQVPANVRMTHKVATRPDASPAGIRVRVDFVDRIRDRLHHEPRLVDLDVDMGAHLYWSDFEMLDLAGLVDVPFAHHGFETAFVREYVFEERKPTVAHVHGYWANKSKVPTFQEWRRDYVEVPGYPAGKGQLHVGTFVRRELLLGEAWPHGADRRVVLEDGVVVHGVHQPSAVASGRKLYLEVGLASTGPERSRQRDDFRVTLFADDGEHLHAWDLPPGYDWVPPTQWQQDEVFHGRFTLPLPAEEALPPGTYTLGLLLTRPDGTLVAPADEALPPGVRIGGRDGEPARFAKGEVRFPWALELLSVPDRAAACTADWQDALDRAAAGACEDAERSWFLARAHRAGEDGWMRGHLPRIRRAFAGCWARSADATADRDDRARRLVKAREWDRHAPDYVARAAPLADELYALGLSHRATADWEAAYRAFSACVDVDRSRSWCRRYAEEARAWRLGVAAP